MSPRILLPWFVGSLLVSCVGSQNFDDGESELRPGREKPGAADAGNDRGPSEPASPLEPNPIAASPDDAGVPSLPSGAPNSPAPSDPTRDASLPTSVSPNDAGIPVSSAEPSADTTTEDAAAPNLGGGGATSMPGSAGSGGAAGAGGAEASTCEVNACNDHGACIDRDLGVLCDCDANALPVCELPLFREIGPSRNNDELLLVAMSADGSTLVGSHVALETPSQKVGIQWTLDGGLQVLEQDPAGPTVAMGVNADGSVISGFVQPTAGGAPYDVVWRDGVLSLASETDTFTATNAEAPTLDELQTLLDEAGIVPAWEIWNVNAASADGKTIFGLGATATYGARWLLRLP